MKMKCIGAATMFAMLATHYARAHRTPVPTARADETTRKAENGMTLKLNRRTATRLLEFGPNTIRAISTNRILNRSLVSFYTDHAENVGSFSQRSLTDVPAPSGYQERPTLGYQLTQVDSFRVLHRQEIRIVDPHPLAFHRSATAPSE